MILLDELQKRTLILDGGMGTELIRRLKIPMRTPFSAPSINLSNPDIVKKIHMDYLEAGADVITTNTFTANHLMARFYGKEAEVKQQNEQGMKLAKEAVADYFHQTGKHCFVGANIGPLPFLEKNLNGKTVDELGSIYEEQLHTLIEGEPDLLIIECAYHIETIKALGKILDQAFQSNDKRIPIMLTVPIYENPEFIEGVPIEEFFSVASRAIRPDLVGFTCGHRLDHIEPALEKLPQKPKVLVPNAGLPDECGIYKMDIAQLIKRVIELKERYDVKIVGGCCGTTPAYIRDLSMRLS